MYPSKAFYVGVDSKKLEDGPGTILCWCFFFSRLLGWRTVIFQLLGFCCRSTGVPSRVPFKSRVPVKGAQEDIWPHRAILGQ